MIPEPNYIREVNMKMVLLVFSFLFSIYAVVLPQAASDLDCRVIDTQGQPVAEVIVSAEGEAIGKRQIWGKTDRDGKVLLKGLPSGEYVVDAHKESEGYPRHLGRIYDTEKRVWQLVKVGSGVVLPLTFQLGPKCATLHLTIEGPDGRPAGGSVKISRTDRAELGYLMFGHGLSGYKTYLLPPDVPIRIEIDPSANQEVQYKPWQSEPTKVKSGEDVRLKGPMKRTALRMIGCA